MKEDKLNKILKEQFNFEDSVGDKPIKAHLSSLTCVKLILTLEDEYGVNLTEKDITSINTIKKIIEQ